MSTSARVRSTGLRASGLFDRFRRRLHRPSYWRNLAAAYPINGLTRNALRAQSADELERRYRREEVLALPDLEIHEGCCVSYSGHDLGMHSPEVVAAFLKLQHGATKAEENLLLQAGLAVRTRAICETSANALIFSPHRDDASLSLGGLIGSRAAQEAHFICNVFTVSTWLGKGFHSSPMRTVSCLRAREEALCNQVLGARGVGLGLWEADIRNYHRQSVEKYSAFEDFIFEGDPNLRTLGESDSIEYALSYFQQRLEPTRIYFPLGLGDHIDHLFLHEFGRTQAPHVHNRSRVYFYEDLPYATYEHVDVVAIATRMGLAPEYVDITEHFETKMQAIGAHRSQFARAENEARLRRYAQELAGLAGMPQGALAERIWR